MKSVSQLFGLSGAVDVQDVVKYQDGEFRVDNAKLMDILQNGRTDDKISVLELVCEEMVNIRDEKKLEIWKLVRSIVDLKRQNNIRSGSLNVLVEALSVKEISKLDGAMILEDVKRCIKLKGIDPDMKKFLVCLHKLIKLNVFLESGILIVMFNEILNYYSDDDIKIMMIELICENIHRGVFNQEELHEMLVKLIVLGVLTNNTLVLQSFAGFLKEYVSIGSQYLDEMYSILSILGCIDDLNKSTEYCESIVNSMLKKYGKDCLITLCDVIAGKFDEVREHRMGNRCVIGSIQILCYLLKYLGSDLVVTRFFEEYRYYLFETFLQIIGKKDEMILVEIVNFINEILEKPYCMNGYFKDFIENDTFWELVGSIDCLDNNESLQSVLNEMFNKLQNLPLNSYHEKRLIEYLEKNYQILSSYNIAFVIEYYSTNSMCVCGVWKWKQNCESIVEKYYSFSSELVLRTLRNAMEKCFSIGVDEPTIKFYINIIFYQCVISLGIEIGDEVIGELVLALKSLNDVWFDKVVADYGCAILRGDLNSEVINKVIVELVMEEVNSRRCGKLMNFVVELVKVENVKIVLMNLNVMSRLRCDVGKVFIKEWEEIDEVFPWEMRREYEDVMRDLDFGYRFRNGRDDRVEMEFDVQIIINVYVEMLSKGGSFQHYTMIVKELRNQMINFYENGVDNESACVKLVEYFTSQIEEIYEVEFATPYWMKGGLIRDIAVDTMYGLIPVMRKYSMSKVVKSILLEYHFCEHGRVEIGYFITVCLYEMQDIMRGFIGGIVKMVRESGDEMIMVHLNALYGVQYDAEKATDKGAVDNICQIEQSDYCEVKICGVRLAISKKYVDSFIGNIRNNL